MLLNNVDNGRIIITGAAGFIGSCMVQYLNEQGLTNLVLVDELANPPEQNNWISKKYEQLVNREDLFDWLNDYSGKITFFIHLGARTDTAEFDYAVHQKLNVDYSIAVWRYCTAKNVPLIYASSAATYGAGEFGYDDDHKFVEHVKPLNPYGISKNEFDKWTLKQTAKPPYWTGLKFFNVYGPNEYHKARMASVIWHSFNQINKDGIVKLFKSHRDDFEDGQQLRDFVYVKDLLKVIYWMMAKMYNGNWSASQNGLYNLGTGKARSFYDLVNATFAGLDKKPEIVFVDMPEDIMANYQYFTEANIQKLRNAGYIDAFYTLEEGIDDYVRNYLAKGGIY